LLGNLFFASYGGASTFLYRSSYDALILIAVPFFLVFSKEKLADRLVLEGRNKRAISTKIERRVSLRIDFRFLTGISVDTGCVFRRDRPFFIGKIFK